jgi:hypothetical protein
MRPLYTATARFDSSLGAVWHNYVEWSGLSQLTEVVSLDDSLCPRLVRDVLPDDWPYLVTEDFMTAFFTDVGYVQKRTNDCSARNILAVVRNPTAVPPSPQSAPFRLEGYDLIDARGSTSALTNCGGFPLAFHNSELSPNGLLISLERARQVQIALRGSYPDQQHADCDVWAIFRAVTS